MWLTVPTLQHYIDSAEELKSFCTDQDLEYCIYGSFIFPEKVRLGLSDVDILIFSSSEELIFPIKISQKFGEVKQNIHNLGIPLQPNLITKWQWHSNLLMVDRGYLMEVKKWLHGNYFSTKIGEILDNVASGRDEKSDDMTMMRYFHRKIQSLWMHLNTVENILKTPKENLSNEQQRALFDFWDLFKKLITYIGASIRVHSWKSVFHLNDTDLFMEFAKIFSMNKDEIQYISVYVSILKDIRNMDDWYEFLKNGWIKKIVSVYNSLFWRIFEQTSKYINH